MLLPLFRIVTVSSQISKSVTYFQKCYSYGSVKYNYSVCKMSGENSLKRTVDGKKQKSIASVWRPVSTQSCSVEGMEVNGPNVGPTPLSNKEEVAALEGSLSSTDKHSISLQVGTSLFRFIKGKGGSMQEQIEKEMGIRIIFPSSRNEETIVIEGASPDSIARASERIQLIIDEAVKSSALDYSHFISLPLAIHPQLVDKLVNFQNSILGINDATIDEVEGQKVDEASHVAVSLKAQEESQNPKVDATKIPLGIKEEVMDALEGQPVSIKLKGLDCMKGSLAKARVLCS